MYPVARKAANLYLPNLVNLLSKAYDVVGADELLSHYLLPLFTCDTVHFNWIERVKGKNDFERMISCRARQAFVYYFALTGKNIVWTLHNKVAHDKATDVYSKKVMETVAKHASRIHLLCRESLDLPIVAPYRDKCVVVPHGDYFNNYGRTGADLKKKFNIPEDHKVLLFSGSIAPYKNIEILLEGFEKAVEETGKRDVTLLIVGKCSSKQYIDELNHAFEKTSDLVRFHIDYVANEELGDYLDLAEALVAPYDQRSSLNSGTFWMACSYHKPMIMPLIGSIKDNPNYDEVGWFYNYDSPEEHVKALTNAIVHFFNDLSAGEPLTQKADKALAWITENSWENNREKWEQLFDFSGSKQ